MTSGDPDITVPCINPGNTRQSAWLPASSVSGFYFAHPEARYFGVGKIDKDQVEDYAARKGMTLAEAERWLSPVLAYDPD